MSFNFSTALDICMLILLAATVFYAARLSYFMSNFRQGRDEMGKLLGDLSRQVTQAENAMAGMRQTVDKSGAHLQEMINDAKFLSDELRFMNETGDNLANRLEKLAGRNRELVELLESAGGVGAGTPKREELHVTPPKKTAPPPPSFLMNDENYKSSQASNNVSSLAGFAIRDRDFDKELLEESDEEVDELEGLADDHAYANEAFSSQAERDLYAALKRTRDKIGAVKK